MAGLQSAEGRMMIDSVVWAQYINVTDRQTTRIITIAGPHIVAGQLIMPVFIVTAKLPNPNFHCQTALKKCQI